MIRRLFPPFHAAAALAIAFTASTGAAHAQATCSNTLQSITVPAGFCIEQVADSLTTLRHFAVAPNGDVYAALQGTRNAPGGLVVLHDTNRDGVYDTRTKLYEKGGHEVVVRGPNEVYFTTNDAVMRIRLAAGDKVVAVDTIVEGLPAASGHVTKSIAFDRAGALYVDIGSQTNSCQVQDRGNKSPGHDPCTELETRAGVWKFDATKPHQTQATATHFATGLRNVVALTSHPVTGELYGVQHGRDQLAANWGFTNEQSAELPAEILVHIRQGDDYGWPYCYYDQIQGKNVLAPEYGGDGKEIGRCASKKAPIAGFPGHWAPQAIVFYTGTAFPARYRAGAFIVFHGSWNRAPLPQAGFKVVFQPLNGSQAGGKYEVFAQGFENTKVGTTNRVTQPLGLATGPDGSLFVGSDTGGKIWRIRAANAAAKGK
jgi:glucose/arabinose dehydrogenase